MHVVGTQKSRLGEVIPKIIYNVCFYGEISKIIPKFHKIPGLSVALRPAKTQISLGNHPVWPESLLSTWRNVGSLQLPIQCTAKILIRLGGCPGWYESSLGARHIVGFVVLLLICISRTCKLVLSKKTVWISQKCIEVLMLTKLFNIIYKWKIPLSTIKYLTHTTDTYKLYGINSANWRLTLSWFHWETSYASLYFSVPLPTDVVSGAHVLSNFHRFVWNLVT